MDSDDSFTMQTDASGFADPSMISLSLDDGNARSLTQKLSIITDNYSMDSTDYGSPLLSADPESASPLDFDAKRHQMNYSTYLSGRAQEVSKRRNLIERLEKARDRGVLVCTIPQLSELTITQLSMVLRRILKSSPGLREFVSDEVLQTIFEDANCQTPLTTDSDRLPHFQDLPNEPDCVTDQETDLSDDEEFKGEKQDLHIGKSTQVDFYHLRRHLISADRYAAAIAWKLIEKQKKLKNFDHYEQFAHQEPPNSSDSEQNSSTCVRCRPLIKRPKRRLFCAKTGSQLLRSNSPPPTLVIDDQCDTDFDFEHTNMSAINVSDKQNTENVMNAYLNHLSVLPPHHAVKCHAAFAELGRQKHFYGFPPAIQTEAPNFPLPLKPVHSNIPAQKRRHDSIREEEDETETDVNYPLKMKNEAVKTKFLLKHPPKLAKSKSAFPIIRPQERFEERVEERIAPLKIKRSSIQLPSNSGVSDDLERFLNPFYKAKPHISPTNEETTDSLPNPQQQNQQHQEQIEKPMTPEVPSQENSQKVETPRSSSPSSSSSDDSSSSISESDNEAANEDDIDVSTAADNPIPPVVLEPIESGAESDDESSTSTNVSDIQDPNENQEFQDDLNLMEQ